MTFRVVFFQFRRSLAYGWITFFFFLIKIKLSYSQFVFYVFEVKWIFRSFLSVPMTTRYFVVLRAIYSSSKSPSIPKSMEQMPTAGCYSPMSKSWQKGWRNLIHASSASSLLERGPEQDKKNRVALHSRGSLSWAQQTQGQGVLSGFPVLSCPTPCLSAPAETVRSARCFQPQGRLQSKLGRTK